MTNWYCLPHKTALGFILIIARSSMVIKLTAGKLVHLSIATFGDVSVNMYINKCLHNLKFMYIKMLQVMKTSMVYLNMLRTMMVSQKITLLVHIIMCVHHRLFLLNISKFPSCHHVITCFNINYHIIVLKHRIFTTTFQTLKT